MIYLKENMKYLRKQHAMTQEQLAGLLESKRSLIGSYEEGRGVPKLSIIKRMAEIFEVSMDHLLAVDLSQKKSEVGRQKVEGRRQKNGGWRCN